MNSITTTLQETQTPTFVITDKADARSSFGRSVGKHPSGASPATFTGTGYRLGGDEDTPKAASDVAEVETETVAEAPTNSGATPSHMLIGSYGRAINDYTLKTLSDTMTTMKGGVAKIFTYPTRSALRRANQSFENKAAQMWQGYMQTKEREGSVPLLTTVATISTVLLAKTTSAIKDHIKDSVINGLTNPMDLADHLFFMGHPVVPPAYFDTKAPDTAGKLAFGPTSSEKAVTYEGLTTGGFKFQLLGAYYKALGF